MKKCESCGRLFRTDLMKKHEMHCHGISGPTGNTGISNISTEVPVTLSGENVRCPQMNTTEIQCDNEFLQWLIAEFPNITRSEACANKKVFPREIDYHRTVKPSPRILFENRMHLVESGNQPFRARTPRLSVHIPSSSQNIRPHSTSPLINTTKRGRK